jgi:hypothetical protein
MVVFQQIGGIEGAACGLLLLGHYLAKNGQIWPKLDKMDKNTLAKRDE